MKIVGLEIQKIEITKFMASKGEVELSISFNDGKTQQFTKTLDVSKPKESADLLLGEIKKTVTDAHKAQIAASVAETNISLVFKGEEDLQKALPAYLEKIQSYLHEINKKKDASGYLDLVRDLKKIQL